MRVTGSMTILLIANSLCDSWEWDPRESETDRAARRDRLVIDGETGYLVNQLDDLSEWVDAIKRAEQNYEFLVAQIEKRDLRVFSAARSTDRFLTLLAKHLA